MSSRYSPEALTKTAPPLLSVQPQQFALPQPQLRRPLASLPESTHAVVAAQAPAETWIAPPQPPVLPRKSHSFAWNLPFAATSTAPPSP